jgi:restriction system protein
LLDAQTGIDSIRATSWSDFELMVGEAFRRAGYAVEERGGRSPDGGVDLVLRGDGERVVVQCKHWKDRLVGVSVVRELLGTVMDFDLGAGRTQRVSRRLAALSRG